MALSRQRRNARTVASLVTVVVAMIGLSFASVPL
jgi:cytochrome c oxidase assembly protein Cox11